MWYMHWIDNIYASRPCMENQKWACQYFNTMSVTVVHSIKSVLWGDMLYFKRSYQLTITGTKTNAELREGCLYSDRLCQLIRALVSTDRWLGGLSPWPTCINSTSWLAYPALSYSTTVLSSLTRQGCHHLGLM